SSSTWLSTPPTTSTSTLSLHDALPIFGWPGVAFDRRGRAAVAYTRWRPKSHLSQLVLARLTPRVESKNVTTNGWPASYVAPPARSEEHTSELQSRGHLVCRLLLEKKKA